MALDDPLVAQLGKYFGFVAKACLVLGVCDFEDMLATVALDEERGGGAALTQARLHEEPAVEPLAWLGRQRVNDPFGRLGQLFLDYIELSEEVVRRLQAVDDIGCG